SCGCSFRRKIQPPSFPSPILKALPSITLHALNQVSKFLSGARAMSITSGWPGRGVDALAQRELQPVVQPAAWAERTFVLEHGNAGRDLVLWLGRRQGGLSLRELGELARGLDSSRVSLVVKRFENRRVRMNCIV